MLSRLWYLILALAVGGALAGAFLNKSAASREAEFQLEEQLRRDHVEAELWQRLDARLRLDALASIAVDSEVRQTLRSSSGRAGTPGTSTRKRLSQKLDSLNAKLEEGKGDLVFAIDAEGEVVATLDKNDMGSAQLDKMPLVRDALRGFMRDDVWVYNGEVYRMAARPVFDGGRYVGAVVHGMAIGDGLAKRLAAKLPNATVVFFYRDRPDRVSCRRSESAKQRRAEKWARVGAGQDGKAARVRWKWASELERSQRGSEAKPRTRESATSSAAGEVPSGLAGSSQTPSKKTSLRSPGCWSSVCRCCCSCWAWHFFTWSMIREWRSCGKRARASPKPSSTAFRPVSSGVTIGRSRRT